MSVLTKAGQIKKLQDFIPIQVTIAGITDVLDIIAVKNEITNIEKAKIRGLHLNKESGFKWHVSGVAINHELRQHDYKNIDHWQSIAAIPKIIENALYAGYLPNQDRSKNPFVDRFEYYLSEIEINEKSYTVKSDIAVGDDGGRRYYDHKLENKKIEQLLISPQAISNAGVTSDALSTINDTRLQQILQALFDENSKKILFSKGDL
jgi:hypothetical protein